MFNVEHGPVEGSCKRNRRIRKQKNSLGSSPVVESSVRLRINKPTSIYEDAGSIPGLA